MFEMFFKPKFYKKCKTTIERTKVRIDTVRKKKNAVYRIWRTDIADLLKNGLEDVAYKRIEAVFQEKERLCCYDMIEQFSDNISSNLSLLTRQKECPEECREAVSSLGYAAARVSEIPELRDLRALFVRKYGNSLESYINRELMEKFKPHRKPREKKIEFLDQIAQEFSIRWDPAGLELKLSKQSSVLQSLRNGVQEEQYAEKEEGNDLGFRGKKIVTDSKNKMKKYSSSDDDSISFTEKEGTDRDSVWRSSSSSAKSVSEDERDIINPSENPLPYTFIPPPYTKPRTGIDESINREIEPKRKQRSIRRRFLKSQARSDLTANTESKAGDFDQNGMKREEMRKGFVYDEGKKYGLKSDRKSIRKSQEEGDAKKNDRSLSFRPTPPDYDKVVARIATLKGEVKEKPRK